MVSQMSRAFLFCGVTVMLRWFDQLGSDAIPKSVQKTDEGQEENKNPQIRYMSPNAQQITAVPKT